MKMLAAVLLLGIFLPEPGRLIAQTTPLKDQELFARFKQSHPCPAVVPAVWLHGDSALGRSPLCPLVVATATQLAVSPDSVQRWIAAHANCVKVVSFEGEDLTDSKNRTKVAIWIVHFVVDSNRIAVGIFDRQTGDVRYQRGVPVTGTAFKFLCRSGT